MRRVPSQIYGAYAVTCYMGSRKSTCHPIQVNASASRPNPSSQAGTWFTYQGGMEGWVDLGYPTTHRPGVELAISRSHVRRPNHYTTEASRSYSSRPSNNFSVRLTYSYTKPSRYFFQNGGFFIRHLCLYIQVIFYNVFISAGKEVYFIIRWPEIS